MLRVCSSASKAHSAIAVNDRASATTAHNASPKITASRWRTPRRCPGSATPGQDPQQARRLPRSFSGQLNQVADGRVNR